jgi:hypothetical protein
MADEERLTKLETSLWGPFGTNGVKGAVERHSKEIGELYGRDEALREDLNHRLTGIYKLLLTTMVTVVVGAGGIITTLLVGR